LAADSQQVTILIRDTGIGIPKDDLPNLFQRFHRGRNVVEYPGSGLGLAIVKAIIDRHQGRVDVESGDTGTEILISLPRSIEKR
jgi:signal transduction histidine kinase